MSCRQPVATLLLAVSALLLTLASGCAHSVHQVYVSSMDKNAAYGKGRWITVEKKDFVILGFAAQSQYIDDAYRELQTQCPGRIAQVTTEHLTSYKFLSYDQRIVLRGLCQAG